MKITTNKSTILASRQDYERYGDENGVIWSSGKWEIIDDGYGLGISDGWQIDRPVIYTTDKTVGYENPEWIPAYVKRKFESLAKSGKIKNRHTRMDEAELRGINSSTNIMAASNTGNEALDEILDNLKDNFDYILSGFEALSRYGAESTKSAIAIASDLSDTLEAYVRDIAAELSK